jgi:hypothetical protein
MVTLEDFRKLLRIGLAGVGVEKSYVAQVPGLGDALKEGNFETASDRYYAHSFLNGHPPRKAIVDKEFYLNPIPISHKWLIIRWESSRVPLNTT